MGCVFSKIYGNHIYNIAVKHEFFGYEIAGIKLHAAIDVQIYKNQIHDCTLGTWLDWQAQGAHISSNLYYRNNRDFMIEVTHGPYLVDNNIFASDYNFDNVAQGGAYIHNLCCGIMRRVDCLDRATPYHFPHTTEVASCAVVYGGDDRLYQNLFVGGIKHQTEDSGCGTDNYNNRPASLEEYKEDILAQGVGDHEAFAKVSQPVYINGNGYLNGAAAFDREKTNYISDTDPHVKILQKGKEVWIEFLADKGLLELQGQIQGTNTLEMVRIVEAPYETPEGTPIILDYDYLGTKRSENPMVGPFENLQEGLNHIRVW
jgi:hypothetical protein